VAILPGIQFGRPPTELTVRIAYVDFDGGRAIEEAAQVPEDDELDDAFVKRNCPRVVTAISRICEWTADRR
jgi:aspartate aminotransferase